MPDRPAIETTDAIEVTPEMLRAGALVIADRFDQNLDWWVEEIAREIFCQMRLAEYDCFPSKSPRA